jgi:hypothetical protein
MRLGGLQQSTDKATRSEQREKRKLVPTCAMALEDAFIPLMTDAALDCALCRLDRDEEPCAAAGSTLVILVCGETQREPTRRQ